MNLGDKITSLRKSKNMTQDNLGRSLNISAQAVSKWERNISQPNLDTIKQLAKLFDISIEELIGYDSNDDNIETDNTKSEEIITCKKCGKALKEKDIFQKEPYIICVECNQNSLREQEEINSLINKKYKNDRFQKISGFKKSLIYGGIIGVGAFLFFMIGLFSDEPMDITVAEYIGTSLFLGLLAFSFSNQLFYDNIIKKIVISSMGKTINMPGFIFNLDFTGILFMLIFKIIIPIFAFLLGLLIFIFVSIIAMLISPLTLPFSLIKQYKKTKKLKEIMK